MSKCHTCGKIADIEAVTCPHCGRPSPTKIRGSDIWGILKWIIALPIVLLIINLRDGNTPANPADTTTQITAIEASNTPAIRATPAQTSTSEHSATTITTSESVEKTRELSAHEDSTTTVVQPGVDIADPSDDFSLQVTLIDARGEIVIQSEPSVFSKNIDTVVSGTIAYASTLDGKWIKIKTSDGRLGFVRKRQLK